MAVELGTQDGPFILSDSAFITLSSTRSESFGVHFGEVSLRGVVLTLTWYDSGLVEGRIFFLCSSLFLSPSFDFSGRATRAEVKHCRVAQGKNWLRCIPTWYPHLLQDTLGKHQSLRHEVHAATDAPNGSVLGAIKRPEASSCARRHGIWACQ